MPIELSPEFKMFDAYLDFLDDGKLTTFAKLAVKYPKASSLFIRAIEDLDSGRVYPFAVTRLPDKLRPRKKRGRPRTFTQISDGRLSFIKVAKEKQVLLAKWNGEPPLPIKELIARVEVMDMPDTIRFSQMSLSVKYALFKAAEAHNPVDQSLSDMFEYVLFDEDHHFMDLLALNEED